MACFYLIRVRIYAIFSNFNSYILVPSRCLAFHGGMLGFSCVIIHIRLWLFIRVILLFVLWRQLIKYAFIVIKEILIARCEPFNYFSQYTSTIRLYQAWYHLISDIFSGCPQHFFELGSWKPLNNDIFLFFLHLILLLKIDLAGLCQCRMHRFPSIRLRSCLGLRWCGASPLYGVRGKGNMLWVLFFIYTL